MRRRLRPMRTVLGAMALAACAAAGAEPIDPPAEAAQIAQAGIASQGVPACNVCHGLHGEGLPAQGAPRLAGLDSGYLERQLADFAMGRRRSAVMAPIAAALTAPQRAELAIHFGALPAVATAAAPDTVASPRGRELAVVGDWSRDAPPCAACHGPNGEGVGSVTPPLVGQTQAYLLGQLTAFRSGERAGALELMNGIATRLSPTDLQAVAAYYASLPLPAGPASGGKP
jgi:cytochrome c553